jgi:hypothetical protein
MLYRFFRFFFFFFFAFCFITWLGFFFEVFLHETKNREIFMILSGLVLCSRQQRQLPRLRTYVTYYLLMSKTRYFTLTLGPMISDL